MNLRLNLDKGCFSELKRNGKKQSHDGNPAMDFFVNKFEGSGYCEMCLKETFLCIGREIFQGQLLLGPPDGCLYFPDSLLPAWRVFLTGSLGKANICKEKVALLRAEQVQSQV